MHNHPPSNRLAGAVSPYLLQHAHNPVDWYPWSDEALTRARTLNLPIFLSIGYAACHWCHVMEEESFNDAQVAEVLNRHFVPIKVDREERPDIDAVYMAAVQAMTGSGGWPLNVFLTPELKPFFGGTYFPPERRWGRPAFIEILQAVSTAWSERRGEVEGGAQRMAAQLASWGSGDRRAEINVRELRRDALGTIARQFDARTGGFTPAPKFPSPSRLLFLLRLAQGGDSRAREMLAVTLDGMAAGGMYDWVGGGFHRYSVDAAWLVPHFEKMLYDNALLARTYGAAGVLLETPRWVGIARETADYLIREMQGPEGGFFSATDADSEGEEGRFFTWTPAELQQALPDSRAEILIRLCRVGDEGNVEGGRTVLRPATTVEALAAELGQPATELRQTIQEIRQSLHEVRSRRVPPALDDKRLAGWNGMAVWAMAYLGAALQERRYLESAQRAGEFLVTTLLGGEQVVRSWRDERCSGVETLEDVAWVIAGLVELFQADGDSRWLVTALGVADRRLSRYRGAHGEIFDTPDDGEPLPARPREGADGAAPAPAGVLLQALFRLGRLTGRSDLIEVAAAALAAEGGLITRAPEACLTLLDAAELLELPPLEVVIAGDSDHPASRRLLAAAHGADQPLAALVPPAAAPVAAEAARLVPLLQGREGTTGKEPVVFVCRGGACSLPVGDVDAMLELLTRP